MNTKEFSTGVMIVLFAGAIGWSISTLIEVDKRTAIMAEKVSENHKMIKPLWEDFIRRKQCNFEVLYIWLYWEHIQLMHLYGMLRPSVFK